MIVTDLETVKVVVVDDNDVVRASAATLLDDAPGIEVVGEAANGEEAIDAVLRTRPNVVLMDMRMPVMDGVEATRRLALRCPEAAVLMHSAFGDDSLVLEALQAGARGYVIKGASAAGLLAAIKNVADGRSHISDEIARPIVDKLVAALRLERETFLAARQASKRLEELVLQRKEFANQAAHELRTPMTALLGYLELLCDSTEVGCEERVLAEGAFTAARRLRRLTEDLEVTAAAERLDLVLIPVGIRSIAEDCVDDLGILPECVEIDIPSSLVACGDEIRLRQVLSNILRNAMSVSWRGTPVVIRATEEAGRVRIDVVDQGPGIESAALLTMFDAFEQKPGAVAGLGVGLSVARELITRMDGQISAINNEVHGATIRISLPGGRP
jgi:signal transduction histidine kinase